MSQGKTKSLFTVITFRSILRERELNQLKENQEWSALPDEEKLQSEGFEAFRPQLCLGPVATIVQIFREAVNHFPDLRCIVFYSHLSQFPRQARGRSQRPQFYSSTFETAFH